MRSRWRPPTHPTLSISIGNSPRRTPASSVPMCARCGSERRTFICRSEMSRCYAAKICSWPFANTGPGIGGGSSNGYLMSPNCCATPRQWIGLVLTIKISPMVRASASLAALLAHELLGFLNLPDVHVRWAVRSATNFSRAARPMAALTTPCSGWNNIPWFV